MEKLSKDLLRAIETAEPHLQRVTDAESCEPILRGGWSRKQVIGHLIDSASNNHQRFVRAAFQNSLEFPAYEQAEFVRVQAFQQADWKELVALWAAYNRHLAHVVAHLPPTQLEVPCRIGSADPVSLRFLAMDYLTHLLHHLRQMGAADQE